MRKIFLLITLLFIIVPGIQVNALEVKVGEEIDIVKEINDDFYIAGGRVDINAPINGDLVVAGGDLNINSDVQEDLIIAGGDIIIMGNIGDDARIAGGNIEISSNIEGDLIIGGGNVRINKGVIVRGDLLVGAGRVVLNGEVMGDAKIGVGELVLNGMINGDTEIMIDNFINPSNTGLIKGNLSYKSKEKIQTLEDSTSAEVVFEKTYFKEVNKKDVVKFISSFIIIKILGLFLFSTLIFLYFEKLFSKVANNLSKKTGESFLYGFLTIIGLPVAIILLFISVIGIPFALFGLFAYIFLFVFLSLINVIVFSSFFVTKYKIKELYKKLLIIFALTLVFGIINGISFIAGFFTIGATFLMKIEIIKGLRK